MQHTVSKLAKAASFGFHSRPTLTAERRNEVRHICLDKLELRGEHPLDRRLGAPARSDRAPVEGVLAGAKALLEHGLQLNLVPDRFPDGLPRGMTPRLGKAHGAAEQAREALARPRTGRCPQGARLRDSNGRLQTFRLSMSPPESVFARRISQRGEVRAITSDVMAVG
jgi:hypothetical protein